jgi:hypothetical protein
MIDIVQAFFALLLLILSTIAILCIIDVSHLGLKQVSPSGYGGHIQDKKRKSPSEGLELDISTMAMHTSFVGSNKKELA